jgi:RNA polymerase sigma-70 factor (sigma-E family)
MDTDDELDFEAFVRDRGPVLLRTAYLLVGDRGQAEDLLQDVLEKTYPRWRRIRRGDDPGVYVRRALVNGATSRWRRRQARVRELPLASGADRAGPDGTVQYDQRDLLLRALATLPARQRAVLVLRYWEDLSEADTAAALQCSIGAVKSQASRGLARLRQAVTAQEAGAPPSGPSGPPSRMPGHLALAPDTTRPTTSPWSA